MAAIRSMRRTVSLVGAIALVGAVAIGTGTIAARAAAPAEAPVVQEHKHDPGKVRDEFAAATKEMKTLVGELEALQAEYQQPASDKRAVAAKFEEVKKRAQATSDRLEAAGFALAMVDPTNQPAREICGAVVAATLQSDDPGGVIAMANMLDKAGAASGDVMMMAATAEMIQSHLEDAATWLGKAEAAGIQKQKIAELRAAIDEERPKVKGEMEKRKAEAAADDLPRVKIQTAKGDIVVELFENDAPNTVANFISLVEKHFYDGTPFHRVIGGFMAQGGDPTGKGSGGPGYAIECEVGAPSARKHFLGSLSMAHAGPNTGGSQFFLTFRPTEHLDGKHTVFGRVVEGFDVLPKITRTEGPMAGDMPDTIVKAEVLRKRSHPYEPKKLPDPRP